MVVPPKNVACCFSTSIELRPVSAVASRTTSEVGTSGEKLCPEPAGRTRNPWAEASRSTCSTWSVFSGRTMAAGVTVRFLPHERHVSLATLAVRSDDSVGSSGVADCSFTIRILPQDLSLGLRFGFLPVTPIQVFP